MLIIWFIKLLSAYRYGENTKPFLTLLTSLLSLTHHYFFTFTILFPQGNLPQACVPSRGTESCWEVLDMPPPHAVGRGPDRLLTHSDVFAYQALVLLRLLSLKQSLLLLESISEQMEFQRAIKRRGPCWERAGKLLQQKLERGEGLVLERREWCEGKESNIKGLRPWKPRGWCRWRQVWTQRVEKCDRSVMKWLQGKHRDSWKKSMKVVVLLRLTFKCHVSSSPS